MNKSSLISDINFRHKCTSYGLNWNDFNIIDDIIILNSPKQNILVLLDENYNTIDIYDKNDDINKIVPTEKALKGIKEIYENTYVKLPYPFQGFSLKQIVKLANRVSIDSCGHSYNMIVNGEIVNDEHDNVYFCLLSYIKFLGQQIEQYFMNLYQMNMMGFEYPNVYKYITKLMNNIDECIDINIKKNNRPFPIDIIKYLGQDRKNINEYNHELYRIIDLLLKQKTIKIKDGFEQYKKIEIVDKDITDLSDISMKLLKILEISDEEVESRYQESNETYKIKEINLQSWLSENISKDKSPVLSKTKNNLLN